MLSFLDSSDRFFLQTGEDFLFEELFCRFRFYGEQLAVDGDADALLTVSGAESRRQIDLIAYVVGCDQLLQLIHDFIRALRDPSRPFLTTIDDSIESHRICYAAERSRRTGETIRMDAAE